MEVDSRLVLLNLVLKVGYGPRLSRFVVGAVMVSRDCHKLGSRGRRAVKETEGLLIIRRHLWRNESEAVKIMVV